MKYTYCIWDFNGTILDDVELGMNSVNTLLSEEGLPTISGKEEYRKKFDFPIIDYYKDLGFDFEKCPYEVLAERWIELYNRNLSSAKLSEGVSGALDFFDSVGVHQSIISASELTMLKRQLNGLGINERFEEVLGIDNIYGDSKLGIAREWRKRHPDEKVIFIGDTTHDCETAEILGADCLLVCSGHQCRERLSNMNVEVFDSLDELIKEINDRL